MCGIAGIFTTKRFGSKDLSAVIARMTDIIRHRGPNDQGTWIGSGVALGHARLSVIDLSAAGHQPMSNENGDLKIVFNGEIYNFIELRSELTQLGCLFKSNTDT